MKNEKIIEILRELWRYEHTTKYTTEEIREALDLAIKALGAWDKLDNIIVEQLDNSNDQKECMTLRWVLDKMSELCF